ncbi:MAG: hypothetical protein BAJALOKI3v1_20103 [Promethearchaeota archaeon]|nr:MAG: hypothetical protein BAJALOKI3v1_20103 [Candidatus Lokiarchaeota archaeon]
MMGKVISVRIDKNLERQIDLMAAEMGKEQSEIVRNLLTNGTIYLAIKGYAEGRFSIGKAAYLANIPLSEFMDLVMDLGIKSKINKDDLLEGYDYLDSFFKK